MEYRNLVHILMVIVCLASQFTWAYTEKLETIKAGLDELLAFIEVLLLTLLYIILTAVVFMVFIKENRKGQQPQRLATNAFEDTLKLIGLVFLLFTAVLVWVSSPTDDAGTTFALFIITMIVGLFPILTMLVISFIGGAFLRNLSSLALLGLGIGIIITVASFILNESIFAITGGSLLFYVVVAPVIEEALKFIGLQRIIKTNSLPMAILAAIIIGGAFAAIENIVYFSLNVNPFDYGLKDWVNVMLNRTFVTANAHGYFAMLSAFGLIGGLSGKFKPAYGLVCAIALHAIFNGVGLVFYQYHAKEIMTFLMGLAFFVVLLMMNRKTKET